jgi:hypothetical protein
MTLTVSETPDAGIADSVAATMAASESELPEDSSTEDPSAGQVDTWQVFRCDALRVSIQHPPDWSTTCGDEYVYICDSEQFGEGERYTYCVYISQHLGVGELSFEEFMVDRNLTIAEYLEFSEATAGAYPAFRTQSVGSMMGMLSYFIPDGDRYVEIDLDPYSSEYPWEEQARYLTIFETMIVTLQLD